MYRALTLLFALSLTGCTVGPDYRSPTIALTQTFAEGSSAEAGTATQARWWRDYDDALLEGLIDCGLAQNLDIRTAIERIDEAQVSLRTTGAAGLVCGSVTAQAGRSGGGGAVTTGTSSASFGPSVVLDIFCGERREREQARAQLDAAAFDVGTARLTFLSSLVGTYIGARYNQEALAITRQNIASRQQTLELVQGQQASGAATELDVLRTQALLDETRASLPGVETRFHSAVYPTATLLAEPAQPLIDRLQRGAPQPRARDTAQERVPADLLRNRPDVGRTKGPSPRPSRP